MTSFDEFSPRAAAPSIKVTLLILTLNEIDGVRVILPQIDRSWIDQILVVDGGSTDGTAEWVRENGFELYVQQRKGIRFAYFEALRLVRGDAIISFSPDGNCPVDAIPKLVEKLRNGDDLVIASRYADKGKSEDDDLITAFGNWLFTWTTNLLHGGRCTDVMTIYRAFRRQLIADLDLDKEESYSLPERLFGTVLSWEPLMSVRAIKSGCRISEVPTAEPPRIGGTRKLQIWRWGAAYYMQIWTELLAWRLAPKAARRQPRT